MTSPDYDRRPEMLSDRLGYDPEVGDHEWQRIKDNHVRFGIQVDSDNGFHVRLRLFAATGGQHLGSCGQLVMTTTEYATFRALLKPMLTDRPDMPPARLSTPEMQRNAALDQQEGGTSRG